MEVVQSGLIWKIIYLYTIEGPCDLTALSTFPVEHAVAIILVGLMDLMVQVNCTIRGIFATSC